MKLYHFPQCLSSLHPLPGPLPTAPHMPTCSQTDNIFLDYTHMHKYIKYKLLSPFVVVVCVYMVSELITL